MENSSPDPLKNKEEVRQNPDPKIDEDFRGFPGGQSTEENVKPETQEEKKTADTDHRDGEKMLDVDKKKPDEGNSDGSANAFDRTELDMDPAPAPAAAPLKKRRSDGSANAFERTEGGSADDTDEKDPSSYY